jgi:hypothetical protein
VPPELDSSWTTSMPFSNRADVLTRHIQPVGPRGGIDRYVGHDVDTLTSHWRRPGPRRRRSSSLARYEQVAGILGAMGDCHLVDVGGEVAIADHLDGCARGSGVGFGAVLPDRQIFLAT